MLEVVRQDFIDTGRAKGLKESAIIVRHMLKNALIPIITVIGLQFGVMLGGGGDGSNPFSPGRGSDVFVVDSIKAKDTPAVLGSVVTLAIMFSIVNLIVDMLYAVVDPRIKSQYKRVRRAS
jgi:peptide/nickel transport system permease protein